MPYTCDALLPREERYASLKYRHARRIRDPYRYTRAELIEIRAFQLTPGMTREHLDILFRWPRDVQDYMLDPLKALDDEAMPFAEMNHQLAQVEDGHAMLTALLEHRPGFSRYVPLYVTRFLQARRARGATAPQLAKEFSTTPERIMRWWTQDIFDPFTGRLRPEIHRGKPVHRSNRRVLAV